MKVDCAFGADLQSGIAVSAARLLRRLQSGLELLSLRCPGLAFVELPHDEARSDATVILPPRGDAPQICCSKISTMYVLISTVCSTAFTPSTYGNGHRYDLPCETVVNAMIYRRAVGDAKDGNLKHLHEVLLANKRQAQAA